LSEAAELSEDSVSVEYYTLCQLALQQCRNLGDRFCIFDVLTGPDFNDTNPQTFRDKIGINNLKYGAAYYPYLLTSLNYIYNDADIAVSGITGNFFSLELGGIRVGYSGSEGDAPKVEVVEGTGNTLSISVTGNKLTIVNVGKLGKPGIQILDAWSTVADKNGFTIEAILSGRKLVLATGETPLAKSSTLNAIRKTNTALYNSIKLELNKWIVKLPPSPAIAGVYASVDRERGVWKAPANVSLNAVIGPVRKITAGDQNTLNIDEKGGKSINAIRSFSGKGTLVWGARTLAGNDNEWRYVPVRRLFIMIEESAKKATSFAVFEPNDLATWLKVKGMIESYLYGLLQQGALAGSTPKAAYYVNVGLGTTMTQQDILEGRMIIEIGIAAVRPAEFIILRFSHKLQEA
jgi:hypothetical protein